jgi:two-component system, response regulator PdtaR
MRHDPFIRNETSASFDPKPKGYEEQKGDPTLSSSMLHAGSPILVVDDDLLRWSMRDALEEVGWKIEEADNADRALEMLEVQSYRAVVTDIEMPGDLNGLDLAWAVTANWPHTGMVITSVKDLPPRAHLPPRAKFLAKPLRAEVLGQAVEEVVTEERTS